MKLKILLFAVLISGMLNAQDTIRSLVITEAFVGVPHRNFIELTNMGDDPIQLHDFMVGGVTGDSWTWQENSVDFGPDQGPIRLPEHILQPGESFLIAQMRDVNPSIPREDWNIVFREWSGTPPEMFDLTDVQIHMNENSWGLNPLNPLDSISVVNPLAGFFGRQALTVQQIFNDTTFVPIDQVHGFWDTEHSSGEFRNKGMGVWEAGYAIAGFQNASVYGHLVRKFSVKQGNKEFAAGVGEDDSEWLVFPKFMSSNRLQPFTLKNHGDYNLDENTLVPTLDGMNVDFANKKITVPWGVKRPDGIMANMEKTPGVAWRYIVAPDAQDSLSFAVHTGDSIEIMVCGTDLDRATFGIEVSEPTASDNIVIPVSNRDPLGEYINDVDYNFIEWPVIAQSESGMDTIRGYKTEPYETIPVPKYFGIPFATRIDTLLERLEKPANATWEIVFVDEVERPDLKDGDMLKVTSENGTEKEYYIKVESYVASDVVELSSITWPDIPDFYRGLFGWIGDTIPGFQNNVTDYKITVPFDVDGIPALVGKPLSSNTEIEVQKATNLYGAPEDRTTTFNVTAEDGLTFRAYNIQMDKEKRPENLEPNRAEPFLSNMVTGQGFTNSYAEICNPGNQPLDLSDYMIAHAYGNTDPTAAITQLSESDDWINRYGKYVPGYKWVSESEWAVNPGRLVQDLAVNPIVEPGDVFCMGEIQNDFIISKFFSDPDFYWPTPDQLDVQFRNTDAGRQYRNPWGEDVNDVPIPGWGGDVWWIFKITNDSVKLGLKPATDPNDFDVVEAFGMADGSSWNFGTGFNGFAVVRKPEFNRPNPAIQGSFGEGLDDPQNEWLLHNTSYWRQQPNFPFDLLWVYGGYEIGQHFFVTPTEYMSTINSRIHKVSPGYGDDQRIWGIKTGTTAQVFMDNIIKADENQTLNLKEGPGGAAVSMDAELMNGNILEVMSADSTNSTLYTLEVSDEGLSSDAALTSDLYTVTIEEQPKSAGDNHTNGKGTITGFEYGTQLKTVLTNVNVPAGANLSIIDGDGAYVPLTILNFDTAYVDVTVNDNTYFEVTAEDFVTTIVYQLKPVVSEDDAFLISNVFVVDQRNLLIENVPGSEYVPGGAMNVESFLSQLIPSAGATMKLVDKLGNERTAGKIAADDKVVVISPSGNTTRVYHIGLLPTKYVRQVTYLAYVLSNRYAVDQVQYVISGPTGATMLDDFMSRITPAEGATAVVVDMDGNVKTSGDLDDGDRLKVTSADGMIEVMYILDLDLTPAGLVDSGSIKLYPNPTDGQITISGLKTGGRIQVFNSAGSAIRELKVQSTIESVSLSNQPAGMYLIVVSDTQKMLGRYKVIRK